MKQLAALLLMLWIGCTTAQTVSGNLLPGTTGTQIYAINQALSSVGAGVQIHGFNYGYRYSFGDTQCTATNQDGSCSWWMANYASVNVNIRDSENISILNQTWSHQGVWQSSNQSYQYRFNNTRDITTLGTFKMTPSVSGNASIYNMYSNAVYTVDPCAADPLSSTTCSGYAAAVFAQQCNSNPLSDSACPGYAQAYFSQQCSSNPLYNSACPGYQQAYYDQQCAANPLYATTCPGYAAAYKTQQCDANPFYATDCPGYAVAYHDQQCSISPLYMSDCSGYAAAYKTQQCSLSPLYATDCPGYAEAYLNQQCLLDSLFSNKCEGYKTAYAIKYLVNLDPAVTTAVNSALTTTVEIQRNDPANVVSSTGNATVDSVVAAPSTTSATSATSPVSVINAPPAASTMNSASAPPPPPPPGAAAEQKADAKKTEGAVASVEKKAGGNATAARAAATEKAKELAKDIGRAATMEAQTATQGLLVGLIGYVPGFSAYQNSTVPDALGATVAKQYYKATVDNRSAQRQLSGANETRWKQIVDSQYNKEQ
jgi:hypothetical protein